MVEYTYDAAGNTVSDLNRGITAAQYDVNIRPRRVGFADGSQTLYLYDAAGLKRRTVHRVASLPVSVPGVTDTDPEIVESVTDYCGDIIYEDSVLTRINLDGGYLRLADNSGNTLAKPEYHFYHCDHLGNNRMDLNVNGGVCQITHYYPYGMPTPTHGAAFPREGVRRMAAALLIGISPPRFYDVFSLHACKMQHQIVILQSTPH